MVFDSPQSTMREFLESTTRSRTYWPCKHGIVSIGTALMLSPSGGDAQGETEKRGGGARQSITVAQSQ